MTHNIEGNHIFGTRGRIRVDSKGVIVDANSEALQILGHPLKELVGAFVWSLVWAKDVQRIEKTTLALLCSPALGEHPIAVTFRRFDGSLLPSLTYWECDSSKGNTASAELSIELVDISARSELVTLFEEPEEVYHWLGDQLPICVCRKDVNHHFTYANRRFLDEFRMNKSEILGKSDKDFYRKEFAEKYHNDEKWVLETRHVLETIELHKNSEDVSRWVHVVKAPVLDGGGKVTGVQLAFWDIETREATLKALREAQTKIELRLVRRLNEEEQVNSVLRAQLEAMKRAEEDLMKGQPAVGQQVTLLKIFLATPGDIKEEWKLVFEAVDEWNRLSGPSFLTTLQLVCWRKDTYPTLGDRPQALINTQALDCCDMLIGIFWSRFGTPTGEAESGTEEEIRRAIAQKKPTMLYFSDRAIVPSHLNPGQFEKLKKFQIEMKGNGLVFEYDNLDVFKESLRSHLAHMARDFLRRRK